MNPPTVLHRFDSDRLGRKIARRWQVTFREWTKAYGGTYSTVLLVAMMVSIVVANEYAQDSLWMYLVIGLPLLLTLQFGLSVIAWQFTEHRRRGMPGQDSTHED